MAFDPPPRDQVLRSQFDDADLRRTGLGIRSVPYWRARRQASDAITVHLMLTPLDPNPRKWNPQMIEPSAEERAQEWRHYWRKTDPDTARPSMRGAKKLLLAGAPKAGRFVGQKRSLEAQAATLATRKRRGKLETAVAKRQRAQDRA